MDDPAGVVRVEPVNALRQQRSARDADLGRDRLGLAVEEDEEVGVDVVCKLFTGIALDAVDVLSLASAG